MQLRHQGRVRLADNDCTPNRLAHMASPARTQNGLDNSDIITVGIIQGLSTSPMFVSRLPRGRRTGYRIEHRYYFVVDEQRDYSDEPPSNRTSLSPGIRLYGPTHDSW